MMHALCPTSQWMCTARAQIAMKPHRVAKVLFCEAHRTAQIACFGSISQEPLNTPFPNGLFPVALQVKRPLRTQSGKRPIKVGKRPMKEGKRPIKAMVLVGLSVFCLMGCFQAPPPWKTAPLERPVKRSMNLKP